MSMNSKNKILIYGGGGIGSYYAGALNKNGHNITLLTRGNHFDEIKKNESPEKFKDYIINLTEFCQKNNVIMLRTIGVVFSDEETRDTQYIK